MALLNTGIWDSFRPGETVASAESGGIDIGQILDEALWSLHASSRADLVFWTEAELIQFLDYSVRRLATKVAVFIGRSTGVTIASTAAVALPTEHIATIHVSVNGVSIRPACTMELEARDEDYLTTEGTPDAWYEDLLGSGVIGLAPVPDAVYTMTEIYSGWQPQLDKLQPLVAGPPPLKAYLTMCLLAECYGKEGEMEMPDVAAHCRGRVAMYEEMMQAYYGAAL